MAKRSDIDKAINNLMNWAARPQWADEQTAVFDAHLGPICEGIGISHAEFAEELAELGINGMVFGMMFEDFISRRLPPDGRNIIDDYLKRRGWRDSVSGRRYLQMLRDSVLSLYEVVEVSPGRHCDLRDLVRDPEGKIIRVFEHMGTMDLVKWDQLAARVLKSDGKYMFSGGILPFPREASQTLMRVLNESRKKFNRELSPTGGKKSGEKAVSSVNQDDLFLRDSCPDFTCVWLMHTLDSLSEPPPEMFNRDGDALLFTETRFPILAGQFDEIAERLDAAGEWQRDHPDEYTWAWLPASDAPGNGSQSGIAIETFRDGQQTLYGSVELKPGMLLFSANSMERAQRGQDVLKAILEGLVGPALSKLQTPEQTIAEDVARQHDDRQSDPANAIDPEIAAEIIRNTLDQHYRRVLDERIPALDNKTPRQCARSRKGRERVVEWLKHLENSELHRAASEGQAPYDSRWMWAELKLTRPRD